MLIYSKGLDKYVRRKILPKILIDIDHYEIKGSFRRKIPYVTDIDIVNNVYPYIDDNSVYHKLVQMLKRIESDNKIIFVTIKCGHDERFIVDKIDPETITRIRPLLTSQEAGQIDSLLSTHQNDTTKRDFYIDELLRKKYRIRWSLSEVLDNEKILPGGIKITFTNTLHNSDIFLMQLFVEIGEYPVGFDVAVVYGPQNLKKAYENAALRNLQISNYGEEYYFMLFPFRFYFRKDNNILKRLNKIIEYDFGIYKQFLTRIDTYHILQETDKLDISLASKIVGSLLQDLSKTDYTSDIPGQLKEISENNTPKEKMVKWGLLLNSLYDEIDDYINDKSKDYFFRFLTLVPKKDHHLFIIR